MKNVFTLFWQQIKEQKENLEARKPDDKFTLTVYESGTTTPKGTYFLTEDDPEPAILDKDGDYWFKGCNDKQHYMTLTGVKDE